MCTIGYYCDSGILVGTIDSCMDVCKGNECIGGGMPKVIVATNGNDRVARTHGSEKLWG